MKKIHSTVLALLFVVLNVSAQGWPGKYKGVMLQGFAWDSYSESSWSMLESQAHEISEFFDLIWVPNSAYAGSMTMNMGYHPVYWFKQDCAFGTETELRSMINTYKERGVGFVADIVINHRNGVGVGGSWVDFPAETYKGKTYQLGLSDICSNDECANKGYKPTGARDTGEGWDGARDLDHTSANVQENVNAYLDFLRNDIGYEGFRYDFVKGYSAKYTGQYNAKVGVKYSVGEYWDGNVNALKNWINGTKVDGVIQSAAFDFALKYYINDAIGKGQWSRLDGSSLASDATYNRYSVTFVDNHDTYRDNNKCVANLETANAYILMMPGTPCVFLEHWSRYKRAIKKMIYIRNIVGISNQSLISDKKAYSAGYSVKVKGDNGSALLLLGNTTGADTEGMKLALEGEKYKIYVDNALDISALDGLNDQEAPEFKMPEFCTPEEGKMYAFFEVPNNWNTTNGIYCWCWDNEKNYTGGSWPGVQCTKVGVSERGLEVWKWVGPANTEGQPTGIIFSVKGSPQTGDLDYVEGGFYDRFGLLGDMTTSGVEGIEADVPVGNKMVKVYSLSGVLLRKYDADTDSRRAVRGLPAGMYIVNGQKIVVNEE